MLCATCLFQGCPPGPLLSGQLMSCPSFCFPLSTASSLMLFLLMLSFFFFLAISSVLVFADTFYCCNPSEQRLAQHCVAAHWPCFSDFCFYAQHWVFISFADILLCTSWLQLLFFGLSLSILSPTCSLHSAHCCFPTQESSHPLPSCPAAAHGHVPFSSLLLLSLLYSMIFLHKWLSSRSGVHRSALAWCLLRVFLCFDYIHTPSPPLHPAVVTN